MRRPLQDGFRIAAQFALPPTPDNRGWYAEWFTYTAPPHAGSPDAPYLQVGMVRSSEATAKLQAFVALRSRVQPAIVRALGALSNTSHRLALAMRQNDLTFSVDGKPYFHAKSADFFAPQTEGTYLQIGHELSHPGDTAHGTVADIAYVGPSGASESPFATALDCYFFSNGVNLSVTHGGGLIAGGTFDADTADVGACAK